MEWELVGEIIKERETNLLVLGFVFGAIFGLAIYTEISNNYTLIGIPLSGIALGSILHRFDKERTFIYRKITGD